MKLPLSWLNDYLKLENVGVKEYCDAMTLSGSKVEGWASEGSEVEGVVFGRILTKTRHTNSDHMWITTVDIGSGEPVQIVTGAQNIEVGQLVPVATNGATLPGGITIKSGKLRGEVSNGMLCSHSELGFEDGVIPGSDPNGILIFQQEYPIGADVMEALGEKETVVEFEITPNRPDCLSVIGLARETAATFDVPFAIPPVEVKALAGVKGVAHPAVQDKIFVFLKNDRVAGMKAVGDGLRLKHRHVLRQKAVEGEREAFGRDDGSPFVGFQQGLVVPCVNAAVGPTASGQRIAGAEERLDGVLQNLLHRQAVFLHLIAAISAAVVGQRQQIIHSFPAFALIFVFL